jgi:hypothetical protein
MQLVITGAAIGWSSSFPEKSLLHALQLIVESGCVCLYEAPPPYAMFQFRGS